MWGSQWCGAVLVPWPCTGTCGGAGRISGRGVGSPITSSRRMYSYSAGLWAAASNCATCTVGASPCVSNDDRQ
jgi:hypothetical protein